MSNRPCLIHVATTDMTLALLLGPQLVAFADAGYEVVTASAPGPFVEQLKSSGIRHEPLRHATRAMAPGQDALALLELRSLFRGLRPDIVHTHNPKPGLYGRAAARAAGVPAIVNTVHGLYALPEDRWPKRALVYSLEHLAARCSHAELVQNSEDMDALRSIGVSPRKLHLLGNGVDLTRFCRAAVPASEAAEMRASLGTGPGAVVCGLVGRLVAEKGYREVFRAAIALRRRIPQLVFVVAGPCDPDKADAIDQAEVEQARAEAGVVFLGMRDDVERFYAAMDIYVLASHREGFPRSAMEAAAMGLPIVATDVRGCRQVVDDGRTGLLVPVGDATALAEAIARLATDRDLRERFGAAGRTKAAREFDDRKVIEITLEVYERLLSVTARKR